MFFIDYTVATKPSMHVHDDRFIGERNGNFIENAVILFYEPCMFLFTYCLYFCKFSTFRSKLDVILK